MNSDQQACEDLMVLLDCIKVATLELAEEQGLTRAQMFVLYWIDRQGEQAMRQLADSLHCDASNITGIVDRLVAQNLIFRQELARDRRTKTLQLTASGREMVQKLNRLLPAKLGCNKLNDQERTALHGIAQKLSS